jgi:hypothetical protein
MDSVNYFSTFVKRILPIRNMIDPMDDYETPAVNDRENSASLVSSTVYYILGDTELTNLMNKHITQSRLLVLKYLEKICSESTIKEILPRKHDDRKEHYVLHQRPIEEYTMTPSQFWSGLEDFISCNLDIKNPVLGIYSGIVIKTTMAELCTWMVRFYTDYFDISKTAGTIEVPDYIYNLFKKYYIVSSVLTDIIGAVYNDYCAMILEYQNQEIFKDWLKSKCTVETDTTLYVDRIKKDPPKFGDVARDMFTEIRYRELNMECPLDLSILLPRLNDADHGRIKLCAADPLPLIVARWSNRRAVLERMRAYLSELAAEVLKDEPDLDLEEFKLTDIVYRVLLKFRESLKEEVEKIQIIADKSFVSKSGTKRAVRATRSDTREHTVK